MNEGTYLVERHHLKLEKYETDDKSVGPVETIELEVVVDRDGNVLSMEKKETQHADHDSR